MVRVFVTGFPSDVMKQSLIRQIINKSTKQTLIQELPAKPESENKRGRKKKPSQVVKSATPQELERKAMDALVELRLKKRAIFGRIKERRERKAKEKAEKEAKGIVVEERKVLVPNQATQSVKTAFMVCFYIKFFSSYSNHGAHSKILIQFGLGLC
jgi:hypothetical protein